MTTSIVYQIRIQEQLGEQWTEWFDPLLMQIAPNGNTLFTGPLRDQAQLHGLLVKVQNLNLTLISVSQIGPTSG
ncbi:hypothetical protein BH10CHL1_BH10CHL1_02310 [soil metagenome]